MICPNFRNREVFHEFNELVVAFGGNAMTEEMFMNPELRIKAPAGDKKAMALAYLFNDKNNGEPFYKTKQGKLSFLFQQLSNMTGNLHEAIRLKSQIYNEGFDWSSLDINGEPVLESLSLPDNLKASKKAIGSINTFNFINLSNKYGTKPFSITSIIDNILETDNSTIKNFVSKLSNLAKPNTKAQFVSVKQLANLFPEHFENNSKVLSVYDEKTNTIYFNNDAVELQNDNTFTNVFLHELAHAASSRAVTNLNMFQNSNKLKTDLDNIFNKTKETLGNKYPLAYSNKHEFVAEIFSNQALRDDILLLEDKSIMKRIIDFIKDLLGMRRQADLNKLIDELFETMNMTSLSPVGPLSSYTYIDTSNLTPTTAKVVSQFDEVQVETEIDSTGAEVQKETYKNPITGQIFNRVTFGAKSFINMFNTRSFEKTKTFAEHQADNLWGDLDHNEKMISDDGKRYVTYEEYVSELDNRLQTGRAKGLIIHAFNELHHTKSPEKINQLKNKIATLIDDYGISKYDYEWFSNNIELIYETLGLTTFSKLADNLKDKVITEFTVASELLGFAGSVDMGVEHPEKIINDNGEEVGNYMSLYDLKTGSIDTGKLGSFILKHGLRTKIITNSPADKAKLQLALYALMIKENNPDQRFRVLQVIHAKRLTTILNNDPNLKVEAEAYIPMIEALLKDKEALKEAGLDEDIHKKLLAKSPNIFNPNHYQHTHIRTLKANLSPALIDQELVILQNMIERLKKNMVVNSENRGLSDAEIKAKVREYQNVMSDLLNAKLQNESGYDAPLHMMGDNTSDGFIERWLGNIFDSQNPLIQHFTQTFIKGKQKHSKMTQTKLNRLSELQEKLKKEYSLGVSNYLDTNYVGLYKQLIKEDNVQGHGIVERLILPKDDEWNNLSQTQKDFIEEYNKIMKSYFEKDSYLNSVAVKIGNKSLSHLELANDFSLGKNAAHFKYYEGFFPKTAMTSNDLLYKYGKGNSLTARFNPNYLKEQALRNLSFWEEANYDQWDLAKKGISIPIKYLGNRDLNSSKMYSHDLTDSITKFVEWSDWKEIMDPIHAEGKAILNKFAGFDELKDEHSKIFLQSSKILETFMHRAVQRISADQSTFANTNGIPLVVTDFNGGSLKMVSRDKILQMLTNWAHATTMWFKPFGAAGNVTQGLFVNIRTAMRYSMVGSKQADFDLKTYNKGQQRVMESLKDLVTTGSLENNKLWRLMEKFDYMPSSTRGVLERKMKHFRERTTQGDINTFMHSLGEIYLSMSTLAAQLEHYKLDDGKSFYESYDLVDGELIWSGGVRGYEKKLSGEYAEISELDDKEIIKLKRVHSRIHGNYRGEEFVGIEGYALGRFALSMKKYFPRILMNLIEKHRPDPSLGAYTTKIETMPDGTEKTIMEWHSRVVEGRLRTLFRMLTIWYDAKTGRIDLSRIPERWKEFNDEQRANLMDAFITGAMFMALWGIGFVFFDDEEDDYYWKQWWEMYMLDNATQQFNPRDLLRTGTSFFTPIGLQKLTDFTDSGFTFMAAVATDDVTQDGIYKGWNKLRMHIPYYAAYADLQRKLYRANHVDEKATILENYFSSDLNFRSR